MAISPSCSRSGLISRERETRPETCIGLSGPTPAASLRSKGNFTNVNLPALFTLDLVDHTALLSRNGSFRKEPNLELIDFLFLSILILSIGAACMYISYNGVHLSIKEMESSALPFEKDDWGNLAEAEEEQSRRLATLKEYCKKNISTVRNDGKEKDYIAPNAHKSGWIHGRGHKKMKHYSEEELSLRLATYRKIIVVRDPFESGGSVRLRRYLRKESKVDEIARREWSESTSDESEEVLTPRPRSLPVKTADLSPGRVDGNQARPPRAYSEPPEVPRLKSAFTSGQESPATSKKESEQYAVRDLPALKKLPCSGNGLFYCSFRDVTSETRDCSKGSCVSDTYLRHPRFYVYMLRYF
ncbi:hypothetical protein Bbelb_363870 [Branchiostoma belcheri]|nr:hypothetical protein Bbelb_363870 [Branchiostoma belcheri]